MSQLSHAEVEHIARERVKKHLEDRKRSSGRKGAFPLLSNLFALIVHTALTISHLSLFNTLISFLGAFKSRNSNKSYSKGKRVMNDFGL
jgi:hypothetical protein